MVGLRPLDGQTKLDIRSERMGPAISGQSMTDEGYEYRRWCNWHGKDSVRQSVDQEENMISKAIAISKTIAIKEAIDIVICNQVCNRDQVGVEHTMGLAISKATAIRR